MSHLPLLTGGTCKYSSFQADALSLGHLCGLHACKFRSLHHGLLQVQ